MSANSSFFRSFALPDNIVEDDLKVSYKNGLLRVNLKKSIKGFLAAKRKLKLLDFFSSP